MKIPCHTRKGEDATLIRFCLTSPYVVSNIQTVAEASSGKFADQNLTLHNLNNIRNKNQISHINLILLVKSLFVCVSKWRYMVGIGFYRGRGGATVPAPKPQALQSLALAFKY